MFRSTLSEIDGSAASIFDSRRMAPAVLFTRNTFGVLRGICKGGAFAQFHGAEMAHVASRTSPRVTTVLILWLRFFFNREDRLDFVNH